jgi:bifunctional DNase/RNase
MTTVGEVGFVEMRLSKVVGLSMAEDDPAFCAVLDGVSKDVHLPIEIGGPEAFYLSASLTGVPFARPMGPQLAAGLLQALGGRIRQVRIDRLVAVFDGTAYGATVEVEGPSGVALVDARPGDALNLVALMPAPIYVAPEVLADAEARLEGDSAEARRGRIAMAAEQMIIGRPSGFSQPQGLH